jgi:hypothetical protein
VAIEFVKSHLSSSDILALDLGSMWLIGAYIPPVTSRWQGWTDVEPIEQFWETVALKRGKACFTADGYQGGCCLFSNPLICKSRSDGSSSGKGRDVFGLLATKKGQNKVTKIHSKEETATPIFLG